MRRRTLLEADECVALQGLITETMSAQDSCTLDEYVNGDNDIPVCNDLDSDTWDSAFMSNLGGENEDDEDEETPEERIDDSPPPPMISSFKEVIQSLEGIQDFLERRGCMEEALDIASQN